MLLAYELNRPLSEVQQYSWQELTDWLAFFKYKAELEKKAIERAKRRGAK